MKQFQKVNVNAPCSAIVIGTSLVVEVVRTMDALDESVRECISNCTIKPEVSRAKDTDKQDVYDVTMVETEHDYKGVAKAWNLVRKMLKTIDENQESALANDVIGDAEREPDMFEDIDPAPKGRRMPMSEEDEFSL